MKKRFLSIMLTAALAFGGIATTPMAASASMLTNREAEPIDAEEIAKLSNEELIEKLNHYWSTVGWNDAINADNYSDGVLLADGSFSLGGSNGYDEDGTALIFLSIEESQILFARYPEIFAGTTDPIAIEAGYYNEEMVYSDICKYDERHDRPMPDYEKLIAVLDRGQYTVDIAGKLTTSCTGNVKTGKKYTITADYETKASDGKDFDLKYVNLMAEYYDDEPTKLKVSLFSDKTGETLEDTFTLKISKSLQKKIKNGKVILTGANAIRDAGGMTRISKDTTKKSGKITLSFKFKAKK